MNKTAKFNIGDQVLHKKMGYRAIIIDADPLFQASGHYNPQAHKRAFAIRNPWYRLLIDNSSQITYVEECLLIADPNAEPINNPYLAFYLHKNLTDYSLNRTKH